LISGNAYAFVRFQNLDMAHRSKTELSGQYIGKFQCKIGYGKVTPTTRIWVGGLGPWTSLPQLEREFDRFGAIKKIDYVKGDSCAYIQYDSMDAAQAAVKEMRGFPLGGPDRRLRIDFADVQGSTPSFAFTKSREFGYEANFEANWEEGNGFGGYGGSSRGYRGGNGSGGGGSSSGRGARGRGGFRGYGQPGFEDDWAKGGAPDEGRRSHTPEPGEERSPRPNSRTRRASGSASPDGRNGAGPLGSSRTLPELARKCDVMWTGGLVLKNSLFPAKFHLTDGETDIVDTLLKEQSARNQLRITQRLRLDPPKLDDVSKRMAGASAHGIFLALAASISSITPEDASVQARPMRNLVAYLKQKEAAGVISLTNKDSETTGVLYAFPPCKFSAALLKRTAPALSEEGLKEDHLVIVVVRGPSN
jgi:RNA-binding protein 15